MRTLRQDRAARRIEAESKGTIKIEVTDSKYERFRAYVDNGPVVCADTAANLRRILTKRGYL